MPRHVTGRSLSANALKKRSARKSIIRVLSPNQSSDWWWGSMAHSLKQGILRRANGISLRFSPGASRHRSSAARHSPWCGTWIRMRRGGCKPFSGAAVEDKTRKQLHALARDVFYGRRGRINARELWEQMNTCSCLDLILAWIVYWQGSEMRLGTH